MTQIDKEKVGRFIAARRKEKGMTQKELAEKLFLSNKAVSKWERGLSLPDVAVLQSLSEVLGVSLSELLRGEKLEENGQLTPERMEELVAEAMELSAQQKAERKAAGKRWKLAFAVCAAVGVAEFVALCAAGFTIHALQESVLLMLGFGLGFGGWACFLAKEELPVYYDQNRIGFYAQGGFRMNLPGVRFNNSNWPHILNTVRLWFLGGMVLYPLLWGGAVSILPDSMRRGVTIVLTLIFCLGFLVAATVVGKRYE